MAQEHPNEKERMPDQVKADTNDHIPDKLWNSDRDPRFSHQEFVCAFPDCTETCSTGSSCHCVLCPWVAPHKENATFFYCDDHINKGRPNLYDELGTDDGEGVCAQHFDVFDQLIDMTAKKFDGRTIYQMSPDEPESLLWTKELIRRIRIWRWNMYGQKTEAKI